jgi:uncharacterized protein with ParB-like and HNH nuclease domain
MGNETKPNFETRAIESFKDYNFFIDEYQRGYKWTAQQVLDLLNDIRDFDKSKEAFYCLQPLAVKELNTEKKEKHYEAGANNCYEVIDGQQRLTTVFLILTFLEKESHHIQYLTRPESAKFLTRIKDEIGDISIAYGEDVNHFYQSIKEAWVEYVKKDETFNNIDNYHFFSAYLCIKAWFVDKDPEQRNIFHQKLSEDTRFIWYEDASNDDSKVVFRNLNSGKIGLTNAELIKALFINNFKSPNKEIQELKQNTFAREWDDIEQSLQDNDFWFFVNNSTDDNQYQTRIDFLFEIIIKPTAKNKDKLYTYHQYDKKKVPLDWDLVKLHFLKLKEWYNKVEWHHLIGYIIDRRISTIADLIKISGVRADSDALPKDEFTLKLKSIIRAQFHTKDNKVKPDYELESMNYEEHPNEIRDVLLLFNILQYQKQITGFRFPFGSFKNTAWTLEHIHAQNTDDIKSVGELQAMIADVILIKEDIDHKIKELEDKSANDKETKAHHVNELERLREKQSIFDESIKDKLNHLKSSCKGMDEDIELKGKQKQNLIELKEPLKEFMGIHKLSNMALLDGPTNSGLGKRPFPKKRDYIVDVNNKDSKTAPYIPLATLNVFLKYYTQGIKQYDYWGYQDRTDYLQAITNELQPYFTKEEQK